MDRTADPLTLREAAERTDRSVTTLRRYIRSGRLRAEMREGRYGPEYFVAPDDLVEAGLDPAASLALAPSQAMLLERVAQHTVPAALFQELQMKHEQLLVQYGMVRAAGLRVLELQGELEALRADTEAAHQELARVREWSGTEAAALRKKVHQAELELEGRALEIAALREKVRALEMLTRNAVTTESIEQKFGQVMEQMRRVDLARPRGEGAPWPARLLRNDGPGEEPGH